MGLLEDLIGGGGKPVTPGLLDAAGYMDPAQYDRARRSSSMDGLWAGLLAGGGPSLTPRNFFSALGTGMQGREQYGSEFDKDQLASSQAAQARAAVQKSAYDITSKKQVLDAVLPQLLSGDLTGARKTLGEAVGGVGSTGGGKGAGAGAGGGGGGSISPADHYTWLLNNGASHNEATLLTSAAGAESSFNPDITHDGGIGYGLYGHNSSRLAGMRSFAGVGEKDPVPWQQQSLYALAELRGQTPGGGEIKAGDMARAAATPEELTAAQLAFERPKGWNTGGGDREKRLALTNQYFNQPPYRQQAANEIPDVGTRSLDQANLPSIRAPGDPRVTQMFPDPSGRAAQLGGPVPAAIAVGVPPAAPPPGATTPGSTVLGAPVDRAFGAPRLSGAAPSPGVLAVPQGPAAAPSASNPQPGDVVDGKVFKGGDPNNPRSWAVAPRDAVTPGQGASLGPPDTVVAAGPRSQVPGSPGGPPVGDGNGPAMLQLAAMTGTPAPAPAATMPDNPEPAMSPGGPPAPAPGLLQPPQAPPKPVAPALPERPALPPAPGTPALQPLQAPQTAAAAPISPQTAAAAQRALAISIAMRTVGLDVPPSVDAMAGVPVAGLTAAAQAAAKQPFDIQMEQLRAETAQKRAEWDARTAQQKEEWAARNQRSVAEYESALKVSEDFAKQKTAAGFAPIVAGQTKAAELGAQQAAEPQLKGDIKRREEQAIADVHLATAGEIKSREKYGETVGAQDAKLRESAIGAKNLLPLLDDAKEQLTGAGIFSGPAANLNMGLAQLATLGGWSSEKLTNTQTFVQQAGVRALAILSSGALGTGSGISTRDLDAAKQMANGDLTVDIKTIKRIMDLSERKAVRDIDSFNDIAKKRDPTSAIEHPPRWTGRYTNSGERIMKMPDGSLEAH